jgi:hypothetical protein
LLVDQLLESDEPSIRLQVRLGIQDVDEAEVEELQQQVRTSPRVADLLSERISDATIDAHPYRAKWYGAHWVLVTLAELGYPSGDSSLAPLREQMLDWLFSCDYLNSLGRVRGLPRLHGAIEGNALWAMLTLGLADERAEQLTERLRLAQWPDGGWNCDRKASGRSSSFSESLIPLRALSLHARMGSDRQSAETADERCSGALELLESKRLPDGGFPAEHRYYRPTRAMVPSQRSLVDWGGVSRRRMNPWVSARAAVVMHAAGRPVDQ